jgi:carboxyl-terminal processing protease
VVTHVNGRWVLGSNPMLEVDRLYKKVQNKDATEEELDKATEAATARIRGGISLVAAFLKLRTGSGDKLNLTVQRAGSPKPLPVSLTTAVTPVEAASSRAVTAPGGGEAGYLRLGAFSDRTGKALRDALAALPEGAPLVLDLRGNPGGTLDAAQAVDAALTQGGTFTVQVGPGGKKTNIASPISQTRKPRPVAVLVDAGTASTAEALAASLADKGVGVVVGASRTFGDGLMQTLYPLPDGSGFLLTTGKFVGPRGTDWNGAGLAPSVTLPAGATDDQAIAAALSALRSRNSVALR